MTVKSWQMLPGYMMNYAPYAMLADAKLASKLVLIGFMAGICTANLLHVVIGQFRAIVQTAKRRYGILVVSGPDSIMHIVKLRAGIEMGGVTATSSITSMKYSQPLWYRSFGKFIGYAMRKICSSARAETAVSMCSRCCPEPACIRPTRFVYMTPHEIRRGAGCPVIGHKPTRLTLHLSFSCNRLRSHWCLLPATTVAIAMGYCVRGVVRGIMFHVGNLLNRFSAAHLDAYNIAGVFSRLEYSISMLKAQRRYP